MQRDRELQFLQGGELLVEQRAERLRRFKIRRHASIANTGRSTDSASTAGVCGYWALNDRSSAIMSVRSWPDR